MNKISGIVTTNSFYYKDVLNRYRIGFSINVDRQIFIHSEITVHFTSLELINFKPGERLSLIGKVHYNKGCYIKTNNIKKLPIYLNYQISL